jgi:hypothetical protein
LRSDLRMLDNVLGLVLAVLSLMYLGYAMLLPEKF